MATAAVPSSNLLDLVRCDLCLENYNDSDRLPKLLNCSHTFCLACVQKYYESKLKNKLPCPNCREIFAVPRSGVQKLKTNIMVFDPLDHLAPFTAIDTDGGVAKPSGASKDNITDENKGRKKRKRKRNKKIPEKTNKTICGLHPGEKCDFYCDDCRDPLCADCMVSLSEGLHKTHKIKKLRDVLTTYTTQHKDVLQLVTNMNIEGKQRANELLVELVQSRDSLMKEAKSKHDKAHQEADKWYQNTTATIFKVHDKLHAQILQFVTKCDLQELQQSIEKLDLQEIDGDLKQSQIFLDQLQSSVISFKQSTIWPTKLWSVDIGKITEDFTFNLGCMTEPALKLPDVNNFPYTIEKMLEITEVPTSDIRKHTGKQLGFKLISDLPTAPDCKRSVGLTTDEAVVFFKDQSTIKLVKFGGHQIITLKQCGLPYNIKEWYTKHILNNNHVLLRDQVRGPSYILNSALELVSTIQEDYGWIMSAESTHWVAFHKDDDDTIEIYDLEQKQLLQTLTPPAGLMWSLPSICKHPGSQGTAVVDYDSRSLSIYHHNSSLLNTHILQFVPGLYHAIACNRRHLYVVLQFPASIFVFSWSGQLVTKLNTQQLRIPEGQWIHNIAVGEDQFTIAVGPCGVNADVSSFKAFKNV